MGQLYVVDLGIIGYNKALDLQEKAVKARFKDQIPDTLFLLEHYPVFTLGKLAHDIPHGEVFKVPKEKLDELDIEVVKVGRGGHVTYHCPGQLVGYPIRKLKSIREVAFHIEGLEETMLRTAQDFGTNAFKKGIEYDPRTGKNEKRKGVWYRTEDGDSKLGAIGSEIIYGNGEHVTMHGFSFSVNADLTPFKWVDPCGLSDIGVISLKEIAGREIPMESVKKYIVKHFSSWFGYETVEEKPPQKINLL